MNWRFTTRASDEVICLAILFGFSRDRIAYLHNLPEDAGLRMQHFLVLQKYLPKELIFWHPKDRSLAFDGMSWVPPTFLGRLFGTPGYIQRDPFIEGVAVPTARSLPTTEDAFADEQGFHVQFPGLTLPLAWRSIMRMASRSWIYSLKVSLRTMWPGFRRTKALESLLGTCFLT